MTLVNIDYNIFMDDLSEALHRANNCDGCLSELQEEIRIEYGEQINFLREKGVRPESEEEKILSFYDRFMKGDGSELMEDLMLDGF